LIAAGAATRLAESSPVCPIGQLVDITPHVSLLAKVGQSGHSVAEAIAELVDNAIDARDSKGPVKVDVDYEVGEGFIEVRDNGAGMSRKELSEALVLGQSTKQDEEIGRFGLGMKTACTSLGRRFEIATATKDSKMAWVATYDEGEFLASGRWEMPVSRQKKEWRQGTRITIHSERIYSGLNQSLTHHLGWTFRHFLADGVLTLNINGERLEPPEYDVASDSVLPLEGEIGDQRIEGWVGLLNASSQRGWYGFALVRHRRVIRRHQKLGFQAHPSTARVVGELHLDGFPTNNLKTDFIRETDEWRELEDWISGQIEPVLAISRAMAHGFADSGSQEELASERDRLRHVLEASNLELKAGGRGRSRPVSLVLGTLHLEHRYIDAGAASPYVEVERLERVNEPDLIMVTSNSGHPAVARKDFGRWACNVLADIVALELADMASFAAAKDEILRSLLSQPALSRALAKSAS
jgi:hypothetical protein